MKDKDKLIEQLQQQKKEMWNAAIDAVLAELRLAPPSRIGEAAFIRRVTLLKEL